MQRYFTKPMSRNSTQPPAGLNKELEGRWEAMSTLFQLPVSLATLFFLSR